MRSLFRKLSWTAIAVLVLLCTVSPAPACTPVPSLQAAAPNSVSGGLAGSLHPTVFLSQAPPYCTREDMDRCEHACMMPGGVLDLNCYEDCIYSIC